MRSLVENYPVVGLKKLLKWEEIICISAFLSSYVVHSDIGRAETPLVLLNLLLLVLFDEKYGKYVKNVFHYRSWPFCYVKTYSTLLVTGLNLWLKSKRITQCKHNCQKNTILDDATGLNYTFWAFPLLFWHSNADLFCEVFTARNMALFVNFTFGLE